MRGYSWGLNSKIMKILLKTVINKIITYAAAIWAFPMTERKRRLLNSIQRPFYSNITRAYVTTSTNALQTLAGVIPLPIKTQVEAISTKVLQLRKPTKFADTIFHPDEYKEKPQKYQTHPPNTNITAFTDGSKIDNKVGCAATICINTSTPQSAPASVHSEWQGHLRSNNSVYQAELTAIRLAINHLLRDPTDTIHIVTDSQSSIQAIQSFYTNSPIAQDIQKTIRTSNKQFILSWTRGHNNCEGNERADFLAKQAALQVGDGINIPWPQSALKSKLKQLATETWQQDWENGTTGRRTCSFIPKIDDTRTVSNYFLTQYISGHGPFPTYFLERNFTSTDLCVCGEKSDPDHYVFHCPLTANLHVKHPTQVGMEFKRFLINHQHTYKNIKLIIDKLQQQGRELCHS
ncbi:uncharacterized protein LOC118190716 [Stegodyphus dumicola]|uniref:uncharacterized protein LOC118190716 n=1 Tax=Stegodyphus dumicola TaxID=202533 RepID=UPI0015B1E742|nr:uncharacterized protein LOC118190716 [Stegodyphus dumicola]